MIFGRQPAFWIGLLATIVVGIVSTLSGEGVISDGLAGRITDLVGSGSELLVLLAPLIAGLLIRTRVTPTAAPALPAGTVTTVITPEGQPNRTVTL